MESQSGVVEKVESFGDVRRLMLETVMGIRDGSLSIGQGSAMAANFKEINSNIQVEINAAKLSMASMGTTHEFGRVRQMGTRVITANSD